MEDRAKWTDLIPDTGLRITEAYDQGDESYIPGIFSVLKSETGSGAQKNYTGKTSFGQLVEFDDGDDVPTVERFKTYTTKVAYKNYGGSVAVTKNLIEDRDFDAELDEMKDLSETANYSMDKSGTQLFNGGFDTATSVNGFTMTWYGDGEEQYSTVHPTVVPGGSTQSNASSTGIKLTHDNLEVARLALQLQTQDNGKALTMAGAVTLVVPMAMEKTGKEITMSELQPQNANNAINTYKGNVNMIANLFMDAVHGGSNTAWFVENVARAKLYQVSRQEKRLESDVNILNKVVTYTVDARWANCSKEWKGTWGSKGDLQSYTS